MSDRSSSQKIKTLVTGGFVALVTGYGLDLLNITPIIKKIATSSFVFASGGWAILVLAFCYWLIDVKKLFVKGSWFFIVVGMNSIFIYLFFSIRGANLFERIAKPFSELIFSWTGEMLTSVIASLAVWGSLWYLCYWLYKNRLFIKI
jgi:predicted acyltransferase